MGAISEAHNALQALCEALLREGERCTELCRLPTEWLHILLDKLASQRQVFILRRSAGFAFGFLSLLRAEPGNCRPVLLPVAMNKLLLYAAQGLGLHVDVVDGVPILRGSGSDTPLESTSAGRSAGRSEETGVHVHWRTCVHSLNIVRLILLDAALGGDLDPYITTAVQLAVRGFRSPRWAVRNSSMMVGAAAVLALLTQC